MALKSHYDVIVIGTGLKQSMIASSAARIGKSVLHLDPNDYYGEDWASFNLNHAIKWVNSNTLGATIDGASMPKPNIDQIATVFHQTKMRLQIHSNLHEKKESDFSVGEAVMTSFGKSIITEIRSDGFFILHPVDWKLANSKKTTLIFRKEFLTPIQFKILPVIIEPKHSKIISCSKTTSNKQEEEDVYVVKDPSAEKQDQLPEEKQDQNQEEKQDQLPEEKGLQFSDAIKSANQFNLDFTYRLLLAQGEMVNTMISSGVHRYLEFQATQSLFMLSNNAKNDNADFFKVPCSKSDVFNTKALSALDKRLLMKFLQFCYDWGIQEMVGEDVTTLNERQLAMGRSLHRPQNKSKNIYDPIPYMDKPFVEFLEYCKLPKNLQSLIIYALAFHNQDEKISGLTTHQGLAALGRHLNSIGRYGETAFLNTMYGTGEIPQAFCRMCAVFGGIYILRKPIQSIVIDPLTEKCIGICDDEGIFIGCSQLIIGADALPDFVNISGKTHHRITILNTSQFIPEIDRGLAVIPPKTHSIQNENTIFSVQVNHSTSNSGYGFSVLHLTTTIKNSETEADYQVLKLAEDFLTKKLNPKTQSIWHLEVTQDHQELKTTDIPFQLPSNIALCLRQREVLTMHEEIMQAKQYFQRLWPNEEFFAKFTFPGAEEDEDAAILKSIVGEAQKQTQTTQQTETEENNQLENENNGECVIQETSTSECENIKNNQIDISVKNISTTELVDNNNIVHQDHISNSDSPNNFSSTSHQSVDEKDI